MHTARRATASIRECLDDDVARRGDLVPQVDRRRFGEGRLAVVLDGGAVLTETLLDPIEEHVAARLGDVEQPTVKPSSEAGRATRLRAVRLRSLVGSRIVRVIAPQYCTARGHRSRPDVAVGPPADDRREQTGTATGVGQEQASLAELRERGCAANASGNPSAIPSAPSRVPEPGCSRPADPGEDPVAPQPGVGEHASVFGPHHQDRRTRARAWDDASTGGRWRGNGRASRVRGRVDRRHSAALPRETA